MLRQFALNENVADEVKESFDIEDDDEVDVIDRIRNDEEICYNLNQSILDYVLTDTACVEYEKCQKYIKDNRNKD